MSMLNKKNESYWQKYKPGTIPHPPFDLPKKLLKTVDGNILDIGTGDGKLAEKLSENGHNVYGIDIAENIIKKNKKRKTNVKYTIQDICKKTKFPDNYFDLIIFRFTLTNIHKEGWKKVGKEVFRILKPTGKVYVLEPLVSDSYQKRYELAKNFVHDKNCAYVFHDKELANEIDSMNKLKKAINENKVSRIIKHYTLEELKGIFSKLELEQSKELNISSPSGYPIKTFEGIFRKTN